MRTFIFTAHDGKPDFGSEWNRAAFYEVLKENEGKRFKITQEQVKRSLSQNNFYWLYLGVIEQETGNWAEDLHELFKRKFLKKQFKKILGAEVVLPGSTAALSKVEFGEYMEKICAETGVPIPDPKDAGFMSN